MRLLRLARPADVAWEDLVAWGGTLEAGQKLQPPPLWLDLNDPGLTFECTKRHGGGGGNLNLGQAAATILPHINRVGGHTVCGWRLHGHESTNICAPSG